MKTVHLCICVRVYTLTVMTIVYIIIHLEWPWPLAMYKVNHFDYCFSKLSLVYTVIINNNPISHWFPTTKVCFFPVLHVKSCRLLWLCSEPLFTSQPSFKNQLLTQSHDKKMKNKKKRKETTSKLQGALKASVCNDKVTSIVFSLATASHRANLNIKVVQPSLFTGERHQKPCSNIWNWTFSYRRIEKKGKRKQFTACMVLSPKESVSLLCLSDTAPLSSILLCLDTWQLLWRPPNPGSQSCFSNEVIRYPLCLSIKDFF